MSQESSIRIHTFGIGSGVDEQLVEKVAEVGRGSCSIIGNLSENLNALVI